jgi:hypothetical protein
MIGDDGAAAADEKRDGFEGGFEDGEKEKERGI